MLAETRTCVVCGGPTAGRTTGKPREEAAAYQQRELWQSSAADPVFIQQICFSARGCGSAGAGSSCCTMFKQFSASQEADKNSAPTSASSDPPGAYEQRGCGYMISFVRSHELIPEHCSDAI